MISDFLNKIWQEAYKENTDNICALLEKDASASVLDVGCGDGQKTLQFQNKITCPFIAGIDSVPGRLLAAKKRKVKPQIVANLEKKWPVKPATYDVVVSNQVIEHISDLDNFISEIDRVLKKGGYCVVSTENLASWHNIFALILGYQDFSHHLIKKLHVGNPMSLHSGQKTVAWSAKDNSGVDDTAHPHIKILTYRSLIKIFEAYGLKYESGRGSGYYPFFGFISKFLSRIDPFHSHFITIKVRK